MAEVVSISRLAEMEGVNRQTVSDLVGLTGIVPGPHPTNGRAKGISPEQSRVIGRVLDYARAQGRDSPPPTP